MNSIEFYLCSALALVCLGMSLLSAALGESVQRRQSELRGQQAEISRGASAQQVGNNIIRETAEAAVRNDKLMSVLNRNGLSVNQSQSAR